MNHVLELKYLCDEFLVQYMKICCNPKEFHKLRQVCKLFKNIISSNFMHIGCIFSIIGDISDMKTIFLTWNFYKFENLYMYKIKIPENIIFISDNIDDDRLYRRIASKPALKNTRYCFLAETILIHETPEGQHVGIVKNYSHLIHDKNKSDKYKINNLIKKTVLPKQRYTKIKHPNTIPNNYKRSKPNKYY